jgi:hypothetical protein
MSVSKMKSLLKLSLLLQTALVAETHLAEGLAFCYGAREK